MSGDESAARHVLLIGMMGAGKTTVGRMLADRLGRRFVDSDAEVRRRTGRSVQEIFDTDGEAAFREQERNVLLSAIGDLAPTVIAVAGGAVLDERNRQALMTAGSVVYLRAAINTLSRRLGTGEGRPLLRGDPVALLPRLMEARETFYEATAHIVVDVDNKSPEAVASEIASVLDR